MLSRLHSEVSHIEDSEIREKIKRRRLQILVHSYLYEKLDSGIISDYTWDMWAKELAVLQDEYPDISEEVEYSDIFKGWTGDTASGLSYDDRTIGRAYMLLRINQERMT